MQLILLSVYIFNHILGIWWNLSHYFVCFSVLWTKFLTKSKTCIAAVNTFSFPMGKYWKWWKLEVPPFGLVYQSCVDFLWGAIKDEIVLDLSIYAVPSISPWCRDTNISSKGFDAYSCNATSAICNTVAIIFAMLHQKYFWNIL